MTHTVEFVQKYYKYAVESEIQTRIPRLFTLAQAALETGWGRKAIGSNLFGIAADPSWTGRKVLVDTFEYHDTKDVEYPVIKSITYEPASKKYRYEVKRYFRDYDNVADCFNDHNKFLLRDRYKKAFNHTDDPKKFATEVGNAGYATGYGYAEALHKLIDMIAKIIADNGVDGKEVKETGKAVVTASVLNLRVTPESAGKVAYSPGLRRDTKLDVLSRQNEWLCVKAPCVGWVMAKYLDNKTFGPHVVNASALNFRNAPNGEIIANPLPRGTEAKVLEEQGDWAKVETKIMGWVHSGYVKML